MAGVEPENAAKVKIPGIDSMLIDECTFPDVPAMPVFICAHVDTGAAAERD